MDFGWQDTLIRKKYILSRERQMPGTPVTHSASWGRPRSDICLPEFPVQTLVSRRLSPKACLWTPTAIPCLSVPYVVHVSPRG